jgi:methionyl-tRNA formyltransferase
VQDNSNTKIAITGSTVLTLNSMKKILSLGFNIIYVFGIPDKNLKNKTNSIDLQEFCSKNKIVLDKSNDWKNCYEFCKKNDVDLIITLGDSRILPSYLVGEFKTIGNHGALLPDVQGGASLVWGRMIDMGTWGISIMEIGEKVDSGNILKTKSFSYNKETTEEEFTKIADSLTVDALIEVLIGDYCVTENKKWQVRISKGTDSHKASQMLKFCLKNNLPVYMPPRNPTDGIVDPQWPKEFTTSFKIANNYPYPMWTEREQD